MELDLNFDRNYIIRSSSSFTDDTNGDKLQGKQIWINLYLKSL